MLRLGWKVGFENPALNAWRSVCLAANAKECLQIKALGSRVQRMPGQGRRVPQNKVKQNVSNVNAKLSQQRVRLQRSGGSSMAARHRDGLPVGSPTAESS